MGTMWVKSMHWLFLGRELFLAVYEIDEGLISLHVDRAGDMH